MRNKKGQQILAGIMVSLLVLILVMQMISPLKTFITTSRSDMDCDNSSITTGTQMACIMVGSTLWYWSGWAIAAAIGIIGFRKFRDSGVK